MKMMNPVIDNYVNPDELRKKQREVNAIKKDISTARGVINRALTQYIKRKIGARNRAQAEDSEAFLKEKYKDLELYESKRDIQDAYGWGCFPEEEYDRLMALWELREQAHENAGKYQDRVTEMLEVAIRRVGDEYMEQLMEADHMQQQYDKNVEEAEEAKRELYWENKKVKI